MPLPHTLAVALYCFLIFWLSSDPSPPVPELRFPHADKALHAVAFGGMAFLVSLGMRASDRLYTPRVQFWAPVLAVALYAMTDEFHQAFVPNRHCDVADWAADVAGALAVQGVLVAGWWRLLPWAGPPAYERG